MVVKILKRYNGELDSIDPIEYGVNLRKKNNDDNHYRLEENDPTDKFIPKNEKDSIFLNTFYNKMLQGWRKEDRRISEQNYLRQLPEFQKNIPNIGEEVYVEFPNNQGEYFEARIEYISEERDQVLIKLLEKENAYGKSSLHIVGYGYPERFAKFYKQKPQI